MRNTVCVIKQVLSNSVSMTIKALSTQEYPAYFQPYIEQAGDEDIRLVLKQNHFMVIDFINSISTDKLTYRYAEGKWSIKDIILHLIDTERVFAYRALRIARKDKTVRSGFDQDDFAVQAGADDRDIDSLLAEYQSVRNATISLFESFDSNALIEVGQVEAGDLSVRAIAFIIVGHENHHLRMIKQKYL